MTAGQELSGWLPRRVFRQEGRLQVEWWDPVALRLDQPFYEDAIRQAPARYMDREARRVTALANLAALTAGRPAVPPAGFVFHISRCGSTLISRMLAAQPRHLVLSEAPPLDAVVRATEAGELSEAEGVPALRAMLHLLGLPRFGEERLFVKWDSWSIRSFPLIRKAFPEVPWIFVYRDPVEVLVSHQRLRGQQMVPGWLEPALLGVTEQELPPAEDLDTYAGLVLRQFLRAGGEYCEAAGGLPIPYRALPEVFGREIVGHFGVPFGEEERRLAETAAVHAKEPTQPFRPDGARKQAAASPALRRMAERDLDPWTARLEALRLGRGFTDPRVGR